MHRGENHGILAAALILWFISRKNPLNHAHKWNLFSMACISKFTQKQMNWENRWTVPSLLWPISFILKTNSECWSENHGSRLAWLWFGHNVIIERGWSNQHDNSCPPFGFEMLHAIILCNAELACLGFLCCRFTCSEQYSSGLGPTKLKIRRVRYWCNGDEFLEERKSEVDVPSLVRTHTQPSLEPSCPEQLFPSPSSDLAPNRRSPKISFTCSFPFLLSNVVFLKKTWKTFDLAKSQQP